jgi:acetylornithine deacetylase/succinyl-diaminopimelate desuccinylase-like protein
MLGLVSRHRAVTDLRRLTGEKPICTLAGCYTAANRLTGSEGLRWAMDYIHEELVRLNYSVEFRDWSHSGKADRNLVARKVGVFAPDEEVLFVAHVDGVQKRIEEHFPAADDNASGAVDLLEAARVFSTYSYSRTMGLLFTTGEEQGSLGSRSYVDQLSRGEFSAIKLVVNVDMVGYDSDDDGVMQLWPGDDLPSLALTQVMSETIKSYQLYFTPRIHPGCN